MNLGSPRSGMMVFIVPRVKQSKWKVYRKDERVRRVEFAQEWLLTGLMQRSKLER